MPLSIHSFIRWVCVLAGAFSLLLAATVSRSLARLAEDLFLVFEFKAKMPAITSLMIGRQSDTSMGIWIALALTLGAIAIAVYFDRWPDSKPAKHSGFLLLTTSCYALAALWIGVTLIAGLVMVMANNGVIHSVTETPQKTPNQQPIR